MRYDLPGCCVTSKNYGWFNDQNFATLTLPNTDRDFCTVGGDV